MKHLLPLLLWLSPFIALGQPSFNLNFDRADASSRLPADWFLMGAEAGYTVSLDSSVRYQGRYALRIQSGANYQRQAFKAVGLTIPARYAGKQIELTGYVKTSQVANGWAGLWLRIDGPDFPLAFDNMENRGVKGTTDWTRYSIKLNLANAAQRIVLGGLLSGSGTAWFDDLTIRINGSDLDNAKLKPEKLTKAGLDTAFRNGSGITLAQLTSQQISNLAVLGRVWGFLKYHHPAIAKGDYNWDAELFRVLPKVLDTRTTAERSAVLEQWISRLGPLPTARRPDTTSLKQAFLKPDLRWLNDPTLLAPTLGRQLHQIYRGRNAKSHYYVAMAPGVGNPEFKNEDGYAGIAYPDGGLRLLSLFRYWNIITYFFPYRHLIQEDWNAVLTNFIPKFAGCTDLQQYLLVNLELIGRVHDTHANIWNNPPELERWRGSYLSPVQVRFIENQAVVTGYYHDSAGRASRLKVGDIITKLDGLPVDQWVAARSRYYPASNQPTRLRDMARDLLRGHTANVMLEVSRTGTSSTTELKRYARNELARNTAIDYATYPQDSSYRMLADSIGFIFPAKIKNSQLPAIQKAFGNAKGIVVDLRCYPSEFIVFTLGSFFHTGPTPFVKFTEGEVSNPGLFSWTKELKVGSRGVPHFPGKVVILINEETQSQAEYTTMAFRAAPNVTVIGSQTAGADGNVSPFPLPGNVRTMISGIGVYYPDGRETQRIGIVPDLEIKPTIQGIREGRDELLDKAIELIKKSSLTATR
ncbi:S41 family peptidase [Nibrella saemangeumensis]